MKIKLYKGIRTNKTVKYCKSEKSYVDRNLKSELSNYWNKGYPFCGKCASRKNCGNINDAYPKQWHSKKKGNRHLKFNSYINQHSIHIKKKNKKKCLMCKTKLYNKHFCSDECKLNKSQQQSKTCLICFDEQCNIVLTCGHHFHIDCISKWIFSEKQIQNLQRYTNRGSRILFTCPNCRSVTQLSEIKPKYSYYELRKYNKQT